MPEDRKRFERNCPSCGKLATYGQRSDWKLANDANRRCISCAVSGRGHSICFYCEAEISHNNAASNLDRKDSSRGYDKDNLVVCCNRTKSNTYTSEEFLVMMRALKEYR
jgi:hypothetical protein